MDRHIDLCDRRRVDQTSKMPLFASVFNLKCEALSTLPKFGKDLVGEGGICVSGEFTECGRAGLQSKSQFWGLVCVMNGHVCNFHIS